MRLFIFFLIILLPIYSYAISGEIYAGIFLDSNLRAQPSGFTTAKYISGIELRHDTGRFTPYLKLETLADKYNNNGSFHPASIRYDIGLNFKITEELALNFSRMCWHPIDSYSKIEQYWLFKISYKFGEKNAKTQAR